MGDQARVWIEAGEEVQHFADPPRDDTAHEWEGATACGATGPLRWVTPENVDVNLLCPSCAALAGTTPPLEGDHPGPV